jgi:hypothetical protein
VFVLFAFSFAQCQAVRWIKNMEAHAGLRVTSITAPDMVRQLESAVQFGQPVLLMDVLEEIDPVLEPLLAKAYIRCGWQGLRPQAWRGAGQCAWGALLWEAACAQHCQ